jgi:hypothetical protein
VLAESGVPAAFGGSPGSNPVCALKPLLSRHFTLSLLTTVARVRIPHVPVPDAEVTRRARPRRQPVRVAAFRPTHRRGSRSHPAGTSARTRARPTAGHERGKRETKATAVCAYPVPECRTQSFPIERLRRAPSGARQDRSESAPRRGSQSAQGQAGRRGWTGFSPGAVCRPRRRREEAVDQR